MHIEVLVEDASGAKLIAALLPQIVGEMGEPHTWRVIDYKGIGRIPKGLTAKSDPSKRVLLNRLPTVLTGYGRTPGIDAVVVVVDSDSRDADAFLAELQDVLNKCNPVPNTLFRLATEEMEAWYLGDRDAIAEAYPRVKKDILIKYKQDSICGTWELLADAIYPGGLAAIQKVGWPLPGQVKCEWAEKISVHMTVESNLSPSFVRFRDGLKELVDDAT